MSDPFKIEGPAVISFSGGRTSAYMLRRVLDAGLQPDVHVLFANTGKERPETLDFVQECSTRWHVPVRWLEYISDEPRFSEVNYVTAARAGEPFEALNRKKKFLPNPVMRLCTQHLKIETMKRFIQNVLHLEDWTAAIGIRYDEPRRWRIIGQDERNKHETKVAPLVEARVTEADVMAFWSQQPFDLQLRQHEGNCDLCFLKGYSKVVNIVRDRPDLARWWAKEEVALGAVFRRDRPSYSQMLAQPDLFLDGVIDDSNIDCLCTD